MTPADINLLIENKVREGRSVEYKSQIPGNTDSEKKEFLADVVSFANADGGDLIFGVATKDGVPISASGLASLNEDKEKLRLENIIRTGLDPRIPAVAFDVVDGFTNGPILSLRIPKSWSRPHMVKFQDYSRFYSRNSAGKYLMDVREIREAFDAAGSIPDRIRRWRDDRLSLILGGESPIQISPTSSLVLHLVPYSSITDSNALSVGELLGKLRQLQPIDATNWDHRFNVDGYVTYNSFVDGGRRNVSYAQVFRSGRIEAVNNFFYDTTQDVPTTSGYWIDRHISDAVVAYTTVLTEVGIQPPIVGLLSIIAAKGLRLNHGRQLTPPLDRERILIPDVMIDDFGTPLRTALKPMFDALWNAFGVDRSHSFDQDGNWKPKD